MEYESGGTAFTQAYKSLNKAQKEAVDTIEGPVMVVAGPGTGKTQILTLRIANILLKTDTKPEQILALTFTESGARAMRERLRRYIGATAYHVPIHTFHGFADTLIRQYPEYYGSITGGRPISDLGKIELLEAILSGGEYKALRPTGNPSFYIGPLLSQLSGMKREYITPDRLAEIIALQEQSLADTEEIHSKGAHKGKVRAEYTKLEKQIERNHELLSVYRAYEAGLTADRMYDFDDMISRSVTALTMHEDFLQQVQETYHYVLADEHQDVNGSQNKLLELLAAYHESPNLFVVGDEKQAIYRFQGASLENFLYFEEQFPGTKVISLTQNYRSGQQILDAAHSLITADTLAANDLRVALQSETQSQATLAVAHFTHTAVEQAWIAKEIETKLLAGVPAEEIAVILRTNREVRTCTDFLKTKGIAATASTETDVLTHPVTRQLLDLLRVVANPEDEGALLRVLHAGYVGITLADLARVGAAKRHGTPLISALQDEAFLAEAGVLDTKIFLEFANTLEMTKKRLGSHSLAEWVGALSAKSGLTNYLMEYDPIEGAGVLRRLFDEIAASVVEDSGVTLSALLKRFKHYEEYNLSLGAPALMAGTGVRVMTAHKSKGLEFEHVFVAHCTDSSWGKTKARSYFQVPITRTDHQDQAEDDERRLLYVAITRAKESCTLTYSDCSNDGRDFIATRFLDQINETYQDVADTVSFTEAFTPADSLPAAHALPLFTSELLSELFFNRAFSVTALNNYRKSPWEYFYRNLLRIPDVQPLHLIYGNVMHAMMQRAAALRGTEDTLPTATTVSDWLKAELGRQPITTAEYTELHEKGLAAVMGYLDSHGASIAADSRQEFSISVTLETGDPDLPEIPLTGVIDRVDRQDGAYIHVVDYKTGKSKTKGQVEGTTKDSDGEYKRQLVFYKLLFSLLAEGEVGASVPDTYELVFLEPDSKGEYRSHTFTITDEEVAALKEEIIATVKNIVSGAFLADTCDPEVCHYCDLVAMLRERLE